MVSFLKISKLWEIGLTENKTAHKAVILSPINYVEEKSMQMNIIELIVHIIASRSLILLTQMLKTCFTLEKTTIITPRIKEKSTVGFMTHVTGF